MAAKKKTVDLAALAGAVEEALEEFLAALAAAEVIERDEDDEDVEDVEDDEDEEDEEEEELDAPVREDVESLGIKDLRELAAQYGIEETKKADILEAFEELYDEDDEEDEDEDDEDEEDDAWDRESLEEEDLKSLRAIAKENGATAADVKGLDQDALIDLILGEEDEDDEDEEDEEEDDDEEEVEELDEDQLKAMTQKDLLALAKELEIKIPVAVKKASAANKKKIVNLILDSGEEE